LELQQNEGYNKDPSTYNDSYWDRMTKGFHIAPKQRGSKC